MLSYEQYNILEDGIQVMGNKSILLTYSNKNRIKFQKYAEFFRFIGVYVCENLLEDIEEAVQLEMKDDFDAEYRFDDSNGSDLELRDLFLEFFEQEALTAEEQDELIRVFCDYKLLQASMTLQYFNISDSIVSPAGRFFKGAAEALEAFFSKSGNYIESSYEIRYAVLYCKQKANLARDLAEGYLYYSIEELLDEALELQKDFPNHSNTWMLIGMICEISKGHRLQAINAFKEARDAVRNQPYVSSILYRIGKNCEDIEMLVHLKNDSYEEAYNRMPKYRNIYKVARQYMCMDEWDFAIKFFKECIHKIKLRGDYLDPLEQEYYFKVNSHLAYIYVKKGEYMTAIEYANVALDFRDNVYAAMELPDGYNKMYFDVYEGVDTEEGWGTLEDWSPRSMILLEVKRMSSHNVYLYLAQAYQGLGIQDIADEYWNLVKV